MKKLNVFMICITLLYSSFSYCDDKTSKNSLENYEMTKIEKEAKELEAKELEAKKLKDEKDWQETKAVMRYIGVLLLTPTFFYIFFQLAPLDFNPQNYD